MKLSTWAIEASKMLGWARQFGRFQFLVNYPCYQRAAAHERKAPGLGGVATAQRGNHSIHQLTRTGHGQSVVGWLAWGKVEDDSGTHTMFWLNVQDSDSSAKGATPYSQPDDPVKEA